jgi:hypothetical protein
MCAPPTTAATREAAREYHKNKQTNKQTFNHSLVRAQDNENKIGVCLFQTHDVADRLV